MPNVPDQPPLSAVGCIGRLADWLAAVAMRGDGTTRALRQWGILAPVIFIALQALQVIIAPIPGDAIRGTPSLR